VRKDSTSAVSSGQLVGNVLPAAFSESNVAAETMERNFSSSAGWSLM
jgi:hypothetical protein